MAKGKAGGGADYNADLRIEYVPIGDVKPYGKNPRKNEQAVPVLRKSVERFKFSQPITVDADNVIIVGHTRLLAAQALGMTEVPIIRRTDLTSEQVKAYRLADNKIQEKSEWDMDLLDEEILELSDLGIDMDELGFGDIGKDWGELDEIQDEQKDPSLKGAHNVIEVVVPPSTSDDEREDMKAAIREALERWPGCEVK